MGYLTNYKLDVKNEHHDQADAFFKWAETKPDVVSGYSLEHFLRSDHDTVKWYDHDKDMKEISKKFPELVFELCGEGEESGDIWKKYYKDGKVQVCKAKITFDEFDEKKLK